MSRKTNPEPEDDMRDEYDFSGGIRGKFYILKIRSLKYGSSRAIPTSHVIQRGGLFLARRLTLQNCSEQKDTL
jgi:hypothetical protein